MTILITIGLYCIKQADLTSEPPENLFQKQILGVVIGSVVILALCFIDYRFICKYSCLFYILILGILAYTLKFGVSINNVKRWITIAGINLQPSELTKVVLILFLSYLCTIFRDKMNKFYIFILLSVVVAIPVILILLEPHLSSNLVILFIFCVIVFSAGISYRVIGIVLAIAVPVLGAIIISVGVYKVKIPFINPYQVERIFTFLSNDESQDMKGKFQQNLAITAIGSGGEYGKLIEEQEVGSKAYTTIYAKESDFIFSIVGEEFGFVGSCIIILLYVIIAFRSLTIAAHAPDYMGRLICIGVSAMILFQTFVNIGVATSILPNTGLPLPFISYGLTSLISAMTCIGLVINVGSRR